MKKFNKKSLVLLVCVALLLTCSVGSTVAYLADKADEVTNTFTPVAVDTRIVESFDSTTMAKKEIFVENVDATNHIPVYVRVTLGAYWVNDQGQIVGPLDGEINYDSKKWVKVTDSTNGFVCYYYKGELAVGDKTENLLSDPINQDDYTKPEGATRLIVTVVHQSIQSQPDTAVKSAWGDAALGYVKQQ